MKILELTNYSAGACGVFARVWNEALLLKKKGHQVKIFSSNKIKGQSGTAKEREIKDGIEIIRFPGEKLGGESFMSWHFEKEARNYNPDIIIAHSYRHPHTTRALCLKKEINCKVFLVTHAPFDRSKSRSIFAMISVWFYDNFIGKRTIKNFDKVIAISKWEYPYLYELGVDKEKIEYIPNGIRKDFFNLKKGGKKKLAFAGRIAEIKNIELVIKALELTKNKIKMEILGPGEKSYLNKLNGLINEYKLNNRVRIIDKTYEINEQLSFLKKNRFFILPSKSEGMPQALVEAMASSRIAIASYIPAHRDLIKEGKNRNGFLFPGNNEYELAKELDIIFSMPDKELDKIAENARSSAKNFEWIKIIEKLETVIKS